MTNISHGWDLRLFVGPLETWNCEVWNRNISSFRPQHSRPRHEIRRGSHWQGIDCSFFILKQISGLLTSRWITKLVSMFHKLTISISEGIRDKKSASSLLSTAFGLRIFFVNLFIPKEENKHACPISYYYNSNLRGSLVRNTMIVMRKTIPKT